MFTYVVLVKLTERGAADVKGMPGRIRQVRENIERGGGRLISWHLTMGHYDSVAVVESPNEESAVIGLLAGLSEGYAHTETMRAFSQEEMESFIAKLP